MSKQSIWYYQDGNQRALHHVGECAKQYAEATGGGTPILIPASGEALRHIVPGPYESAPIQTRISENPMSIKGECVVDILRTVENWIMSIHWRLPRDQPAKEPT